MIVLDCLHPSTTVVANYSGQQHVRRATNDDAAAGPAVRPLEFPSPEVRGCARVSVPATDHRSGEVNVLNNVLVSERNRGYCILKKLSDAVYGSVRLCMVLKRQRRLVASQQLSCRTLDTITEESDADSDDAPVLKHSEVEWETTGKFVVVKIVNWAKVRHLRGRHLEDPVKEVAAMQLIGDYHPNIIGSIEVLQDEKYMYSIMPHYSGGDLYGRIIEDAQANKSGRLDESQARNWFEQLISGLRHLQMKGVCHRDLSLDNLLLHDDTLKIIDMGLCLRVPFSDMMNQNCVTDVSEGSGRRLIRAQGQCGRWMFMSPEVAARDDEFDGFAIDLWAAGVILYMLLVGLAPFRVPVETDSRFQRIALDGKLKESLQQMDPPISDAACDLLQNMLWRHPADRLTLSEVMEHPWMDKDYTDADNAKKPEKKRVRTTRRRKLK